MNARACAKDVASCGCRDERQAGRGSGSGRGQRHVLQLLPSKNDTKTHLVAAAAAAPNTKLIINS